MRFPRLTLLFLTILLMLAGSNTGWAAIVVPAPTPLPASTTYYFGEVNGAAAPSPDLASGLSSAVAISSGIQFNLAIKNGGTVWAWGLNSFGQLGQGDFAPYPAPVRVPGLTNIIAISAGGFHSLALKSDGTVYGWGDNSSNQIGASSLGGQVLNPARIAGLTNVVAVAAGGFYSLALKNDGTVWAWGRNDFGQLGNNTNYGANAGNPTPVKVSGVVDVIAISAGHQHALALKNDGKAWGWGNDQYGQIGNNGLGTSSYTPVEIAGIDGVTAISGGFNHSLMLKSGGSVWTLGNNGSGQLGNTSTAAVNPTPDKVAGLAQITQIAAGFNHNLVIKSDGTAWAWGSNDYGQLGRPVSTGNSTPTRIQGLQNVRAVAGGYLGSLVMRLPSPALAINSPSVKPAVPFYFGEVNGGGAPNPTTPTGLGNAVAVAAGTQFNLALKQDGSIWAWGLNSFGQLGQGNYNPYPNPVRVSNLTGFSAISAGGFHTLALKSDGSVWGWGDNSSNQLGPGSLGTQVLTPVRLSGLTNVVAVAAGGFYSLVLKNDGTVWAWGRNDFGQIGNGANYGSTSGNPTPARIAGLMDVTSIAAGFQHGLALTTEGLVWGWGDNQYGQIGTQNLGLKSNIPAVISGIDHVTAISGGLHHTLALKDTGSVWAWGNNGAGQLGNTSSASENPTPAQVTGIASATQISAGYAHSLALLSDKTLWGWGDNYYGQLGNSTNVGVATTNPEPAQVPNLTDVVSVAGGYLGTVALSNLLPVAVDFTQVIPNKTSPQLIKLQASDPHNLSLTYSIVGNPLHGTLSNLNGQFVTYTPDGSFTTTDRFTFRVNNGAYNSESATCSIVLNSAPVLVNLEPARADGSISGSGGDSIGTGQVRLTLTVSDANGTNSLRMVYVTFSNALSNKNGLALSYDAASNKMYLRSDDGNATLGGQAPQSAGSVENSFGRLEFGSSTVDRSGTEMTISFLVTPKEPFFGPKKIWAKARDTSAAEVGFTQMATWTVRTPPPPTSNVQALSFVEVIKPEETSHRFSLKAYNPDAAPLQYVIVTPPAHGTLSAPSGAAVTFTPGPAFPGTDSFTYKINDGYTDSNTATVTLKYNSPPVLVSLTPATADGSVSGSGGTSRVGQTLKLTLKVSDVDSADRLRAAYVTFNQSLSNGNGIALSYDLPSNKLYLRSSNGSTTLGGQAPGSAGTVENDFGILDFSQSSVTKSGDDLTVIFAVTPKTSFTGLKKLWGSVKDSGGLQTAYTQTATWTVNAGAPTLVIKPAANKPSAHTD